MTREEILDAVRRIREEGYAVIIWQPEELQGYDPDEMEDMSIAYGFDLIDMNKTEIIEHEPAKFAFR
jgi:hypothetical protein